MLMVIGRTPNLRVILHTWACFCLLGTFWKLPSQNPFLLWNPPQDTFWEPFWGLPSESSLLRALRSVRCRRAPQACTQNWEEQHAWANASPSRFSLKTRHQGIGPCRFLLKFILTNGSEISLKVLLCAGIRPQSALLCRTWDLTGASRCQLGVDGPFLRQTFLQNELWPFFRGSSERGRCRRGRNGIPHVSSEMQLLAVVIDEKRQTNEKKRQKKSENKKRQQKKHENNRKVKPNKKRSSDPIYKNPLRTSQVLATAKSFDSKDSPDLLRVFSRNIPPESSPELRHIVKHRGKHRSGTPKQIRPRTYRCRVLNSLRLTLFSRTPPGLTSTNLRTCSFWAPARDQHEFLCWV